MSCQTTIGQNLIIFLDLRQKTQIQNVQRVKRKVSAAMRNNVCSCGKNEGYPHVEGIWQLTVVGSSWSRVLSGRGKDRSYAMEISFI